MANRITDFTQYIGKKIGMLTILGYEDKYDKKGIRIRYAKCKCDCGNTKLVKMASITSGITRSCGCLISKSSHLRAKIMGKNNRKAECCKICGGKHYARGLCRNCYEKERRNGKLNEFPLLT
jgi:hypothetical protein